MESVRAASCEDDPALDWQRYFRLAQADAAWCMLSQQWPDRLLTAPAHLADDFLKIASRISNRDVMFDAPLRSRLAALSSAPEWPLNWIRFAYLVGTAAGSGVLDERFAFRSLNRLGLLYARWRLGQPANARLFKALLGHTRFCEELAPAIVALFVLLQPQVAYRAELRVVVPGIAISPSLGNCGGDRRAIHGGSQFVQHASQQRRRRARLLATRLEVD